MIFSAYDILTNGGKQKDSDINLFSTAMAFCLDDHNGIVVEKYFHHIEKLIGAVKNRHTDLIDAGAHNNAATQLAALKHIIYDQEGYHGDLETYDDLQNVDMIRVIDRRRGMPISLSLIYIHVGRACGWMMAGLNFPGHFLCRIEKDSTILIFDAFNKCQIMGAPELRAMVKKFRGKEAELSAEYYQPCGNRDILFRLQNNVKLRMIEAEDYEGALRCVEMMRLLDDGEYRLCLDAGVLYMKTGRFQEARDVLEKYILLTPNAQDKLDATRIIREIGFLEKS